MQDKINGTAVSSRLNGMVADESFQSAGAIVTEPLVDALGSVMATVASNGAVLNQYTYEPFGRSASSDTANRYQFNGRETDDGVLYYYRMRYYDASLSRFLSEDPTQWEGGVNFYSFVDNAPTRFVDPFGLQAQMPGARPDPACCSKKEINFRIFRVNTILSQLNNGKMPTGYGTGGSTGRVWSCDPAGWCTGTPGPTFKPGCDFRDKCVNYCCKQHEWFHFTDRRRFNRNWDLTTRTIFLEKPAYEVELKCLKSFR